MIDNRRSDEIASNYTKGQKLRLYVESSKEESQEPRPYFPVTFEGYGPSGEVLVRHPDHRLEWAQAGHVEAAP